MTYKIKVEYKDGNSFGTSENVSYLPLSWENLEIAERNLKNVADHYNMVKSLGDWKADAKTIFEAHQDKEWFVKKMLPHKKGTGYIEESLVKFCNADEITWNLSHFDAEHCINLFTDSGNKMQIMCFWHGHFQTLLSLEIVVEFEGMKIEF